LASTRVTDTHPPAQAAGPSILGSVATTTFWAALPDCRLLDVAASPANRIATSQIALPKDICTEVYGTTGYESKVRTFSQVSLATDNVFGDDGGIRELGTMSGSIDSGLTVDLAVPVGG
jgi:hypothetical protein